MDQTKIRFTIADRSYKLVVKLEEQALFNEAVRLIELQMGRYAEHFEYQDKQDLLAMVALQYTSESLTLKATKKQQDFENFLAEELLKIEKTLDEAL